MSDSKLVVKFKLFRGFWLTLVKYRFFVYGAQRAAPYVNNSLFSMAMRGSGDTAIDLTQAEAITVLQNVIVAQKQILNNVFGNKSSVAQLWCLYKEVQGYYEAGMTVPDDITLLWTDDNFGNIRRLPLANETSRSGGAGVYYHIDYVGPPRDYKWINTIQLEKTCTLWFPIAFYLLLGKVKWWWSIMSRLAEKNYSLLLLLLPNFT